MTRAHSRSPGELVGPTWCVRGSRQDPTNAPSRAGKLRSRAAGFPKIDHPQKRALVGFEPIRGKRVRRYELDPPFLAPHRSAWLRWLCGDMSIHRSHFGSRYQSGRCALRSPPFSTGEFESRQRTFSVGRTVTWAHSRSPVELVGPTLRVRVGLRGSGFTREAVSQPSRKL